MIEQLSLLKAQFDAQSSLSDTIAIELSKGDKVLTLDNLAVKLQKEQEAIMQVVKEESQSLVSYLVKEDTYIIKKADDDYFRAFVLEKLKEHHKKYYLLEEGLASNFFSSQLGFSKNSIEKKYMELLLIEMKTNKQIRPVGATWSLFDLNLDVDKETQNKLNFLEKLYLSYEMQKPIIKEIEEELRKKSLSKDEIKMYHKYLLSKGKLSQYQDDFIHLEILEKVVVQVKEHLKAKPDGINLSEFRQLVSCTKKIIPTLVGMLEAKGVIKTHQSETHTIMQLS